MCLTQKTPQVVKSDPKAEAEAAAADAAVAANADAAARKTQRRMSALSTGAGVSGSAISAGKPTLGG